MTAMLRGGARWAVTNGWGMAADLERTEEHGCMEGGDPDAVSQEARRRQRDEMGTLGSGNHYLEMQELTHLVDPATATAWGLRRGELVVMIHCGSRGVAEEAPGAYRDVDLVVEDAERGGLARRVARLAPRITVKG